MRRPALVAFLLLALAACTSPCKELGNRICACQPVGSARDNCKTQVSNQLSGEHLTSADDAKCDALLGECHDPADDPNMCKRLQSPEGKEACGLAYPPDTTPPTVSLASSAESVTAAGSIILTASATDDASGVLKVEFYEDTTLLATAPAPPYTTSVSYTAASVGTHTYTAKATDVALNSATSEPVAVVVTP